MADSRPSTDEKAADVVEEKPEGFFARRKAANANNEKNHGQQGEVSTEVKPVEREVPPISFTQLFRCVVVLQHQTHS